MKQLNEQSVTAVLEGMGMGFEHNGVRAVFDRPASLESRGPGALCFVRVTTCDIQALDCSVLIAPRDFRPESDTMAVFRVDSPRLAFIALLKEFFTEPAEPGIHKTAEVHPSCTLGSGVAVGRNTVIMAGCRIADNCTILDNVVIHKNCVLEPEVVVRSGAVIGSSGFGFERGPDKALNAFPQVGHVVLEQGVEIGCNTCVDRGTLDATVVGRGSKISNLCQVAHNARIGRNVLITGCCQICGSVKIGDNVHVGPSAVVLNKLTVGDNARIQPGSVVVRDVEPGQTVSSGFAAPHRDTLYIQARNERWLRDLRDKPAKDK